LLAFFVNLAVTGIATFFFYLSLAVWTQQLPSPWLPVFAAALSIGSYRAALEQVKQYGVHVKSAFDLYRGELATQLGLELPRSAALERQMWHHVGNMMIFRSAWSAKQLDAFRASSGTAAGHNGKARAAE
jgi:hypothetical protein